MASSWPLPALLVWAASALLQRALLGWGAPPAAAWAMAASLGVAAALLTPSRARQLMLVSGHPLATLLAGQSSALPAWAWLVPLALLALAYPLRTWRDAPLFPTPADALRGLAQQVSLPPGARVLDAGCGLGHGLRALRREYPQAQLSGIEWSAPLAWLARLRAQRWGLHARIRRGDMWAAAWSQADLVYVFQRPESMARVWAKARAELAPGSTLVSLAFEVPGVAADAVLPGHEAAGSLGCALLVWVYRLR